MKALRLLIRAVLTLLALLVIVVLGLFLVGRNRLSTAPSVSAAPLTVTNDAESIERGKYLANVSACRGCHGPNLEGTPFQDGAPIGYVPAPNLTSGMGGVAADYSDEAWALAIRHGVAADGRTIVIMPSFHYDSYGDEDLADLIAYLKTVPAVDNDLGARAFQFPGNIIFGVFAYGSWAVNSVDHEAVGGPAPTRGVSAEYGEYLIDIASCGSCHAENLAGNYGQLDTPLGPNLTSLQNDWSRDEFAAAVRSGINRDGEPIDTEMPWQYYGVMDDSDIDALWNYLTSLDVLADGQEE